MKKWIAILMALVLVLSLAACGNDETDTKTPDNNTQNNGDSSFAVTYKGVKIALHAPAAEIVTALGTPVSYEESQSCAFEGLDKTYDYGSIGFTTYPKGDVDYINSIWFQDDLVNDSNGISIGSSNATVEAAYGAGNYNAGSDSYTVTKGNGKLQIKMKDGAVKEMLFSATFD